MQELKRQYEEAKKAQQQATDVDTILTRYAKPKSQEQLANEAEQDKWVKEQEKRKQQEKPFDYSSREAVDIMEDWKRNNRDMWPEERDDPDPYAWFDKQDDDVKPDKDESPDEVDDWEYPTDADCALGMGAGDAHWIKAIARHNEEEDDAAEAEDQQAHNTSSNSSFDTPSDTPSKNDIDHEAMSEFQRQLDFLKTITPEVEEEFGVFEPFETEVEGTQGDPSNTASNDQAPKSASYTDEENIALPEIKEEEPVDLDAMVAENNAFMFLNGYGDTNEDITQFALDGVALVAGGGGADAAVKKREADALKKKQEMEKQQFEVELAEQRQKEADDLKKKREMEKKQLEVELAGQRQKEAEEKARKEVELARMQAQMSHQRMMQRAQGIQQSTYPTPQLAPQMQQGAYQMMQPYTFQQPRLPPSSFQGTIPSPMMAPTMAAQQQYPPNPRFLPSEMAPAPWPRQPIPSASGLPIPSPNMPPVSDREIDDLARVYPGQLRDNYQGFLELRKLQEARAGKPAPPPPTLYPLPPPPPHPPTQAHRAPCPQPAQPSRTDMLSLSEAAQRSVQAGWRVLGLGRTAREGFSLQEWRGLDRGIQLSMTPAEIDEIKSHMTKADSGKLQKSLQGKKARDEKKLERAAY
jgi:uncharacterized membrane protein